MNDLLTDSFVSDTKDAPRGRDIEMGMQAARNNSDLGMEAFNKQIQEIDKQVDKVSGLLKKLKVSIVLNLVMFHAILNSR